jgi:hypothetical protein
MRALTVACMHQGDGWAGVKNLVLAHVLWLNTLGLVKACLPILGKRGHASFTLTLPTLVGQPLLGRVVFFVAPLRARSHG